VIRNLYRHDGGERQPEFVGLGGVYFCMLTKGGGSDTDVLKSCAKVCFY
jgi:hypothetical protein